MRRTTAEIKDNLARWQASQNTRSVLSLFPWMDKAPTKDSHEPNIEIIDSSPRKIKIEINLKQQIDPEWFTTLDRIEIRRGTKTQLWRIENDIQISEDGTTIVLTLKAISWCKGTPIFHERWKKQSQPIEFSFIRGKTTCLGYSLDLNGP